MSPAPREIEQNLEWYSVHILHSVPACLPQPSWLFLGAHHKSRPDLFRSPLRWPRHHAFRDTCCPLAKTNKTPHHRPARFLPGFAAKAISRAPFTRATSPRVVFLAWGAPTCVGHINPTTQHHRLGCNCTLLLQANHPKCLL